MNRPTRSGGLIAASLIAAVALVAAIRLTGSLPAPPPRADLASAEDTTTERPYQPSGPADPAETAPGRQPLADSALTGPQNEPDDSTVIPVPDDPRPEPPDAWLEPHHGLDTAHERAAIDALLSLAETLDFRTFGARIKSLAGPERSLADYLLLAFRAFLVLDNQLTESAFVREPYLEQARAAQATDNWPSWVFLDMSAATPLTRAQLSAGIQAALRGHSGAQAVFARRSAWFSDLATPAETSEIRRQIQSGNPYLQLLQLQRTGRNLWRRPEAREALDGLRQRLRRSPDPLGQWLSSGLPEPEGKESGFSGRGLIDIAGAGYLTALEELRLLATRGAGRWMATDAVTVQDALTVFRQMEARLPDNPVISGSLCELSLHRGDYQAAWNYLQKMAYTDRWASEVEDYSCLPSQSDEFARQMIGYGVITQPQWDAHIETINRRRRSIRNNQPPEGPATDSD